MSTNKSKAVKNFLEKLSSPEFQKKFGEQARKITRRHELSAKRQQILKNLGFIPVEYSYDRPGWCGSIESLFEKGPSELWLLDNVPNVKGRRWKHEYVLTPNPVIWFENPNDAMEFKLRFG